ncbi:MAG TPA: hypothetical protein VF627_00180 [Abditibacterium sp.]|jgi:NitT/TauT family transport system permease protein
MQTPVQREPKPTESKVAEPETAPLIAGSPAPIIAPVHSSAALQVGDLPPRRRPPFLNLFLPNRSIAASWLWMVAAVEAALFLGLWLLMLTPYKVLPSPGEVLSAFSDLWLRQGLGQELAASFSLNAQALFWSTLISLGLAYLTVIPVFRPLVTAISKGRFLSLVGFSLVATLIARDGQMVKLSLLTFSISVFYVTSMASVIAAIPRGEFEHARTLRMSEWRVVWEVVILGTVDKAFEVLRQTAAMGWMMLTAIEVISRSGGGVGIMLWNENRHMLIAGVFAIQGLILAVGILQDLAINALRRIVCPYADLTLERK